MTPLVNPETGRDKLVHSYTCPFFGATVYDRAECANPLALFGRQTTEELRQEVRLMSWLFFPFSVAHMFTGSIRLQPDCVYCEQRSDVQCQNMSYNT